MLPEDEREIDANEIQQLCDSISSLKDLLNSSSISEQLKRAINRSISEISAAINRYPISGAKSFEKALVLAKGELVDNLQEMKAVKDQPEIKKLGDVIEKVDKLADRAIKAEKLVKIGYKAIEYFKDVFP